MITWFLKRKILISFNHPIKSNLMMVITVKPQVKISDMQEHHQRLLIRISKSSVAKVKLNNTIKDLLKCKLQLKSMLHQEEKPNSLSLVARMNQYNNTNKRKEHSINMTWIKATKHQNQHLDKEQSNSIKRSSIGDSTMRNQFNINLMVAKEDMPVNQSTINSNKAMNQYLDKE